MPRFTRYNPYDFRAGDAVMILLDAEDIVKACNDEPLEVHLGYQFVKHIPRRTSAEHPDYGKPEPGRPFRKPASLKKPRRDP
jgi:hypothetical protein